MRVLRPLACGAALIVVAASASGQEPAKFFEENCAVCHAIGGPPGTAPDLKNVTKRRTHTWLVRFILNPQEAAKTDPDAAAIVKDYDDVMPATEGGTPDLADALLHYIDTASGAPAPAAAEAPAARAATAADLAAGRDLYQGRRALDQRAPACVSCHRIDSIGGLGGGTLGPDLTKVSQRLGGAHGVSTWLSNPPTKVMRAVYRPRPLGDTERFALAAMLVDESVPSTSTAASRNWAFLMLGAAGAMATLVLMALVWSRRMTAVRRPLVDAARRRAGDGR
jgi:mono/diheme cytochrome c family protein